MAAITFAGRAHIDARVNDIDAAIEDDLFAPLQGGAELGGIQARAFAAQTLALVSLPFHFEISLRRSQVETGLLLTPWPVSVAVLAPVAGWLSDRVSSPLLCGAGMATMAAGLAALSVMSPAAAGADVAWRMALCGIGFGMFQSPNNRLMLTAAPRERAGAAGGMLGTARLTGQTLGAVLTALLFEMFAARGEIIALQLAAGFALAAGGLSLMRLGPRSGG